jgi:hypothetical protein
VVGGNKPSLYPHVDRLNQPAQQEDYRFVKEVRGQVGGPSKIWVHNPKLAKAAAPLGAHFHPGHYSLKPAALRRRFLVVGHFRQIFSIVTRNGRDPARFRGRTGCYSSFTSLSNIKSNYENLLHKT